MQSTVLLAVLLVVTVVPSASHTQQNSWARYQPRTLQSLIDAHRDNASGTDFLVSARSFPSQVKLVYLAKSRPVSGKRRQLLRYWDKMDTTRESVMNFFKTEMLFREGKTQHWLIVQKPLVDALRKEAKPGESINAYVIFMGGAKLANQWEWVFAMNEFEAPPTGRTSSTNQFPQSE